MYVHKVHTCMYVHKVHMHAYKFECFPFWLSIFNWVCEAAVLASVPFDTKWTCRWWEVFLGCWSNSLVAPKGMMWTIDPEIFIIPNHLIQFDMGGSGCKSPPQINLKCGVSYWICVCTYWQLSSYLYTSDFSVLKLYIYMCQVFTTLTQSAMIQTLKAPDCFGCPQPHPLPGEASGCRSSLISLDN